MARCCSSGSCACVIIEGQHVSIAGTGSSQDPFVITGDVGLAVTDNTVFDLTLSGAGTLASPWTLSVAFAATATLDDLPNVDTTGKANADVLSWNSGTQQWEAAAPTTVAPGAISTDTSLDGDGSGGDPLEVLHNATRFTGTTATGIGLTDAGINRQIRKFANSAARTAASPAPDLNTLSMLDTAPGVVDYWNGAAWVPQGQFAMDVVGEFLDMSGPYAGSQLTMMVRQVADTTDGAGLFEVLSVADLTGYAGVLSVDFQESGVQAYHAVLNGATDHVEGIAYRADDGLPLTGQSITGVVTAWVY